MTDIPGYEHFTKIEAVNKGWSGDKKYYIETDDDRRLLLRIADFPQFSRKQAEFRMMERAASLGVPMSIPVTFGVCDSGKNVFQLFTWCDGGDAETLLPLLPETEQYVLGVKSGEILRTIHSIPAPETQENWAIRFNKKMDIKIKKYRECGLRFDGDEKVIDYIEQNRHLLENRIQCYQHGDYHVGNMIISQDNKLSIIDWNRNDFGDPWEEFNRIVWSAAASPHFATGQLCGYFGGEPPLEFFKLLLLYISTNTLSSIYWAIPFGQKDIDTMMKQSRDVLAWFDNMRNPVPSWFIKDFYIQYIDGIPYKLKSPFDFSFISKYGKVFKVFDDQDSGNICFGVNNNGRQYFVKYAGAETARANDKPNDAIARLKAALPVYRDLRHPSLISLLKDEEIGGGYAAVFDWVDGECMGKMYPLSRQKFMRMPPKIKKKVFEEIMIFHAWVAECGYAAIDFYDGSIMYDFGNSKTVICDIDFYSKKPFINQMGRLWGSSRFMSPEEFTLGAEIDEVTNVYTMGATAFALFTNSDRSPEKWPLSMHLYDVVKRAVSDERGQRQRSIKELIEEWTKRRFDGPAPCHAPHL